MMHLAQAPRSRVDAARRPTQVYGEMLAAGYGAVGEFHYVHHGPTARPTTSPTRWRSPSPRRRSRSAWRSSSSPPPTTAAGDPPLPATFCDVESFLARVDALREWADGRDGVSVAVAAHSVRAVPPDWLEAIAGYADDHGLAAPRPRLRAAARGRASAAPSTAPARSSCWRRTGFLGPAHERRARASTSTSATSRCWPTRDTIVVTCPTTEGNLGDGHLPALAYRDAGRAAGDRLGLAGARRPVRGDARARDRRAPRGHDAPRAAGPPRRPVGRAGAQRPGQPRPARAAQTIDVDLEHPDLRGVGSDELALALATCASAGVVARQASRVRAGGGSLS